LQDPRIAASRQAPFFENRLVRWLNQTLIAVKDNQVVGLACWADATLEALFVVSEFRKFGFGALLLTAAEREMRKTSKQKLSLDCLVGNETARRFYEKHGWCITETVRQSISTPLGEASVSAWVMVKA